MWFKLIRRCLLFFIVAIFGGNLLCVKSSNTIAFYEWEGLELIRRIEINPKSVSNMEICNTYMLFYNKWICMYLYFVFYNIYRYFCVFGNCNILQVFHVFNHVNMFIGNLE